MKKKVWINYLVIICILSFQFISTCKAENTFEFIDFIKLMTLNDQSYHIGLNEYILAQEIAEKESWWVKQVNLTITPHEEEYGVEKEPKMELDYLLELPGQIKLTGNNIFTKNESKNISIQGQVVLSTEITSDFSSIKEVPKWEINLIQKTNDLNKIGVGLVEEAINLYSDYLTINKDFEIAKKSVELSEHKAKEAYKKNEMGYLDHYTFELLNNSYQMQLDLLQEVEYQLQALQEKIASKLGFDSFPEQLAGIEPISLNHIFDQFPELSKDLNVESILYQTSLIQIMKSDIQVAEYDWYKNKKDLGWKASLEVGMGYQSKEDDLLDIGTDYKSEIKISKLLFGPLDHGGVSELKYEYERKVLQLEKQIAVILDHYLTSFQVLQSQQRQLQFMQKEMDLKKCILDDSFKKDDQGYITKEKLLNDQLDFLKSEKKVLDQQLDLIKTRFSIYKFIGFFTSDWLSNL